MGLLISTLRSTKNVDINKDVELNVNKDVQSDVQLNGSLATAEASADATVPPPIPVLDIVLLQDLSSSFADDLPNLQFPPNDFVADLLAGLGGANAGFGVSSFIDYPFAPFGGAGDFPYRTDLGVTINGAAAQTALNGLVIGDGGDLREAQLVGLQQVALRAELPKIGYRAGAERFVVLSTDDDFHFENHFPGGGNNDNDTDLMDGTGGGVEDYPSIADIAAALGAANVTPIFTVAAPVIATYTGLLAALNLIDPTIGGAVVPLSPDSSNFADAMIEGLTAAGAGAALAETDTFAQVSEEGAFSFSESLAATDSLL